jgi:hypothetical protein
MTATLWERSRRKSKWRNARNAHVCAQSDANTKKEYVPRQNVIALPQEDKNSNKSIFGDGRLGVGFKFTL